MSCKVYIVEEEMNFNKVITRWLKNEGWNVKSFFSGNAAMNSICETPDIWILNINLPDMKGYDLIYDIKKNKKDTPVIFMANNFTITERVFSLEIGGDDYIQKPFSPRELIIRVHRLLEKICKEGSIFRSSGTLNFQEYTIHKGKRVVLKDNDVIELTSKEFDLLTIFAQNMGQALSREQLLNQVWGVNSYINDRVVDDLLRRLRRKLPNLRIETIYGYGYRACG